MGDPIEKKLCSGWSDELGDEVSTAYREAIASFERDLESAANAVDGIGSALNMAEAVAKIPVPGVPGV